MPPVLTGGSLLLVTAFSITGPISFVVLQAIVIVLALGSFSHFCLPAKNNLGQYLPFTL
jgi:hypothetical protein